MLPPSCPPTPTGSAPSDAPAWSCIRGAEPAETHSVMRDGRLLFRSARGNHGTLRSAKCVVSCLLPATRCNPILQKMGDFRTLARGDNPASPPILNTTHKISDEETCLERSLEKRMLRNPRAVLRCDSCRKCLPARLAAEGRRSAAVGEDIVPRKLVSCHFSGGGK